MAAEFDLYYRCPDPGVKYRVSGNLSDEAGHFRWGRDLVCYGRTTGGRISRSINAHLYDVSDAVQIANSSICLPFDVDEIIRNLYRERYTAHFNKPNSLHHSILIEIYYLLRPYLSVTFRKYLQRFKLRDWKEIPFPQWPVDFTVDRIQRRMMALQMRAMGIETMPFIWFWPDRFLSCAIITHDVETTSGRDFCSTLMDLDESFGFRSSFQVVPESRYSVPQSYLEQIHARGFEVNVHDLKHDGRLFSDREEFLQSANRINEYARDFGAVGFRSGVLYRNQEWYDAFDFDYDMSVPNVGNLDPQHGGCCTVMPYFIGNLVELPLTCTQDYTLFHMLQDYSTELWRKQISLIMENHGLVTILVHPDYIMDSRPQQLYKELLSHMESLRNTTPMWTPLPREVALWWRQRSKMNLVQNGDMWEIDGPGKERASVAYAKIVDDEVTYSLQDDTIRPRTYNANYPAAQ